MLGVQKLTRSGLNGVSERDFWKTNLPFSRLIKALHLRGENWLQNAHFYKQKGPVKKNPLNWTGSVFPLLTMVCQTYVVHASRRSTTGSHENDGNDKDNSASYKQGAECWTRGNHGNHGNDENHGNPECKPRVPQTTCLETPKRREKHSKKQGHPWKEKKGNTGSKTHPKSRNTKKDRVCTNFFEKFAWTFAFFPVTQVRTTINCSGKTFSDELSYYGWTFSCGCSSCEGNPWVAPTDPVIQATNSLRT